MAVQTVLVLSDVLVVTKDTVFVALLTVLKML